MYAPHHTAHTYQQPPERQSVPFPQLPTSHQPAYPPKWVYQNPLPQPPAFLGMSPSHPQPYPSNAQPGPSRSKGRDYLLSLSTGMSNLDLAQDQPRQRTTSSPVTDKPLPRLPPPPPLPNRPYSTNAPEAYSSNLAASTGSDAGDQRRIEDYYAVQQNRHSTPGKLGQSSHHSTSLPLSTPQKTPPKSFRPSINLSSPSHLRPPHSEPRTSRPYSDSAVPLITPPRKKPLKAPRTPSIIVIDSDSDTASASSSTPVYVTTRSPARRKRATSENPSRPSRSSAASARPSETPRKDNGSSAVRCAGFTRKGAPCQRLVKAEAPYLTMIDPNVEEGNGVQARYCKDHAGMICNAKGFYWRSNKETTGIWVDFDEYIPDGLGQQTQALLRMTMESPLTDKETPGFLYAYELRDLQNGTSSFFKVGRTDNVPRRIGEWTTRCRSHTPTLRDMFPLSNSSTVISPTKSLGRTPTLPTSYLPGAFRQTTNPHRTCPAVKRWERLVHLELADLASRHAPDDYTTLKDKCGECQAVHREIFSLGIGERVYEERVMEVVCRWERFIRKTNPE